MLRTSLLGLVLCAIFSFGQNGETKAAYFKMKENSRKQGSILKTISKSPSVVSCGLACLQNSRCTSTNFYHTHNGRGVCELMHAKNTDSLADLEYREGAMHMHYAERMKDCRFQACSNGGSCIYDNKERRFTCLCTSPLQGEHCEMLKDVSFNFTTLGSYGRIGPANNAAYRGTMLEDVEIVIGSQIWTVPVPGHYRVTACGAAGGDGKHRAGGGRGAKVNGTTFLHQGVKLKILVGQQGQTKGNNNYGSGGGGSFVVYSRNGSRLVVAGGGGGGGSAMIPGDHGQANECGSINSQCNGNGGNVCATGRTTNSGGGGGFQGDGLCVSSSACVAGGKSFISGGAGGTGMSGRYCDGGFGGGGACDSCPGGGGGYSGGGVNYNTTMCQAGGGGSFRLSGWDWSTGYNSGDGFVLFELLM